MFGAAASTAPRGGGTETQAWINSIMNGGAAGRVILIGAGAGAGTAAVTELGEPE